MSYSTPRTWTTGEVVTAAMLNQDIRDNVAAIADIVVPGVAPAWTSWTPTFTNFTLGNGSITYAKWVRVGRTIFYRLRVVLGSSSSMGTEPEFSLPATAATYEAPHPIGQANYRDSGIADYGGVVFAQSSTTGRLKVYQASTTYLTTPAITPTVPITWGVGDSFMASGFYEAAS